MLLAHVCVLTNATARDMFGHGRPANPNLAQRRDLLLATRERENSLGKEKCEGHTAGTPEQAQPNRMHHTPATLKADNKVARGLHFCKASSACEDCMTLFAPATYCGAPVVARPMQTTFCRASLSPREQQHFAIRCWRPSMAQPPATDSRS